MHSSTHLDPRSEEKRQTKNLQQAIFELPQASVSKRGLI